LDEIRREAGRIGRDLSRFFLMAVTSARFTAPGDPQHDKNPRNICTGRADQVLSDLQRFADAGYSLVVLIFDCSGRVAELEEQIQRFGEEVIPAARVIKAKGGWASTPSPI
jgi:hypothetical protein